MTVKELIRLIEQQTPDSPENSYDMKYVNGGFSNSVNITPGVGDNTGKVYVSINIFGGGEKRRVGLPVSPKAKKLLAAYQIAVQKKDPSADKIKADLEEYYKQLKDTISKNFIEVMKEMDRKAKQILIKSIQEVNR